MRSDKCYMKAVEEIELERDEAAVPSSSDSEEKDASSVESTDNDSNKRLYWRNGERG